MIIYIAHKIVPNNPPKKIVPNKFATDRVCDFGKSSSQKPWKRRFEKPRIVEASDE